MVVASLALGTVLLNALDLVALFAIGLTGSVAAGQASPIDWPLVKDLETEVLVIAGLVTVAILLTVKTGVGIFIARVRQLFLANLEVDFSALITRYTFSGDLSHVRKQSRSEIEWSILRSTGIAFGSVLGQGLALFAEASLAIMIFTVFIVTDWVSALTVMAYFLLVLAVFQLVASGRGSKSGEDYASGSVAVGLAISDTLIAYKEIVVQASLDRFLDRIRSSKSQSAHAQALHFFLQSLPRLVVELALVLGVVLFFLLQLALSDGNPELGVIAIFLLGSVRIMSALLPLYRALMQLRYDAPQAQSSQALINQALKAGKLVARDGGDQGPNLELMDESTDRSGLSVKVENLTFSYPDRGVSSPALQDVNLDIEGGTMVAVIGPSGAGKSTLIDVILGLNTPDSGDVLLSGIPPRKLREIRPGVVGYVPQKPGIVSGTIRENVALGLQPEEADDKRIWEALRKAKLDEFVESLDSGLSSLVGAHSERLSGGQSQRLGFARALYSNPRLLVLDEATSGLDAETEASLSEEMKGMLESTTQIVVAHRLSTIQHADIVIVLEHGRIVACDSFENLKRTLPMMRKYIELLSIKG